MANLAGIALCVGLVCVGCGGAMATSPTPTPVLSAVDLAFCVTETNRLRSTIGRAPLSQSASLETFAATAAEADHKSGDPHGYFRVNAVGAAAENQANRWPGSGRAVMTTAIAAFWSEGPGGGHYENMAGNYNQLGCGAYQSNGSVTFVQDFRP